jgi:hypothetical protein
LMLADGNLHFNAKRLSVYLGLKKIPQKVV